MKRIAFTIAFNSLHHLRNNLTKSRVESFDHWVIVEGASLSEGSTSWCKKMPDKYHFDGHSVDGTFEWLKSLKHDNVSVIIRSGMWQSKDQMVNTAIDEIKHTINLSVYEKVFLWGIDSDEFWEPDVLEDAEKDLLESGGKTGMFLCDFYVGKDIVAKGEWGEGLRLPYRRLWDWDGSDFKTHEPPILKSGNSKEVLLRQRFRHDAYLHRKDVKFKNDWYTGHENLLSNWDKLQKINDFPVNLTELISGHWGKTNTIIVKQTH